MSCRLDYKARVPWPIRSRQSRENWNTAQLARRKASDATYSSGIKRLRAHMIQVIGTVNSFDYQVISQMGDYGAVPPGFERRLIFENTSIN